MIIYKANDELISILLSHGFIDTTSKRDKEKGKKSFKLSKRARKEIHFDYEKICIQHSFHKMEYRFELSENELKILFLYFQLNSIETKEFFNTKEFSFKIMEEKLLFLTNELRSLKEFDLLHKRQNKIERILCTYKLLTI
jgi:hypothetical protein